MNGKKAASTSGARGRSSSWTRRRAMPSTGRWWTPRAEHQRLRCSCPVARPWWRSSTTKHPRLAARYLVFLAREDNMRAALPRHANIPAATTLVKTGVDYPHDSERVRAALAACARQMPNVPAEAYRFQGWRYQRAALNSLTTRASARSSPASSTWTPHLPSCAATWTSPSRPRAGSAPPCTAE